MKTGIELIELINAEPLQLYSSNSINKNLSTMKYSHFSKQAIALADFIEKNPNCQFEIDNDGWYISKEIEGEKTALQQEFGEQYKENQIADSADYSWDTQWYSNSAYYGAGLAEAMVILLNRRGFRIVAKSV